MRIEVAWPGLVNRWSLKIFAANERGRERIGDWASNEPELLIGLSLVDDDSVKTFLLFPLFLKIWAFFFWAMDFAEVHRPYFNYPISFFIFFKINKYIFIYIRIKGFLFLLNWTRKPTTKAHQISWTAYKVGPTWAGPIALRFSIDPKVHIMPLASRIRPTCWSK